MRVAPCSVWSSVITKACSIVCTCVLFTYACLPLHVEGEFPIRSVFLMWLRPQYSRMLSVFIPSSSPIIYSLS